MNATSSELRIPADAAYVVVAKRAAAAFGYVAGLDIEAVDDLGIAIAQACENAIRCAEAAGTLASTQIRLSFRVEDRRLDVQVRTVRARPEEIPAATAQARAVAEAMTQQAATRELALRVMGLFVDDCRYRVDERTGGLRVRLTKFRV